MVVMIILQEKGHEGGMYIPPPSTYLIDTLPIATKSSNETKQACRIQATNQETSK
jgi:hypothetical protein